MTTDRSLGYDIYVGPVPGGGVDMLPDGAACGGVTLVRNAMVARSMADTIPMLGAPGGVRDFGKDVRAWVGSPAPTDTAAVRARELAMVYGRDPRLDQGSITVEIRATRTGSQYDFAIHIDARTTDARPISMVLGVNAISVDTLAQQSGAAT